MKFDVAEKSYVKMDRRSGCSGLASCSELLALYLQRLGTGPENQVWGLVPCHAHYQEWWGR